MRRTKIVCTIGPAVDSEEKMRQLVASGMDVARFNFSHGTHESHRETLNRLREVCRSMEAPVAFLLDTKGPEIRTGAFEGGKAELKEGSTVVICAEPVVGTAQRFSTTAPALYEAVAPGAENCLDDGLISMTVDRVEGTDIHCTVKNSGIVKDSKGVNLPNSAVPMPFLSERDLSDLRFAVEEDYDFVAASFVRCGDDVVQMRQALDDMGGQEIMIVAKIENRQGIDNLDEILQVADAVMVARGDMGVELPAWEVPGIQKKMIKQCRAAGKPVITATQMLDSMSRNPRPTRAEVSDVANAVFDGTDAIMLSGETASGLYPVEALTMMAKTAEEAEHNTDYWGRFRGSHRAPESISAAISHACCTTAMDLEARAILTVTQRGVTARMISGYRPGCPIVAVAVDLRTRRQLALNWGVVSLQGNPVSSTDELFALAKEKAFEAGIVDRGDVAVITAGIPVGISGSTNLIKAEQI
jgi:pyruvate kinase